MRIDGLKIYNFRKMKNDVEVELDKQTIIVGKNNTGKTSVAELVVKFLTSNSSFRFEDFSCGLLEKEFINSIYSEYQTLIDMNSGKSISKEQICELEQKIPHIGLEFHISVDENDNLAKIKCILIEFDNNDNLIVKLKYKFSNLKKCISLFEQYNKSILERNASISENKIETLDFFSYLKRNYETYFSIQAYASKPNNSLEYSIDLRDVCSLFNVGIIAAQRKVDDTSDQNSQTISGAIWNYYLKVIKEIERLNYEDENKSSIGYIKDNLNNNYDSIFSDLIKQVNENILVAGETLNVKIESEFDIEEILKKNSKLKYINNQLALPESYNGLGYNNLMYMFIQIITYKDKFKKEDKVFNMLFIEEPESHLHPQMQSTFLNKVEEILECEFNINTIITTHSSYILQSTDLNNIRCFLNNNNQIVAKSLKKFFEKTEFKNLKSFLTKYFRINTCDLFFADKAILIEGTAERILMPIFIKKCDDEDESGHQKLTKQHITVLEVGGAYAHKFYELLNFLEVKTLIVTDIDSVSGQHNTACKCDLTDDMASQDLKIKTSNPIVKEWFRAANEKLYIKNLIESFNLQDSHEKNKMLVKDNDGYSIRLAFQLPLSNTEKIWGRTFEEQLIYENAQYFCELLKKQSDEEIEGTLSRESNSISLRTAVEKTNLISDINDLTKEFFENNTFDIVKKISKTDFAFDLLLLESWKVPAYIKEGLLWLKK